MDGEGMEGMGLAGSGGGWGREVLEWPHTAGGGGYPPDPPSPDQVTIVGKSGLYHWENLVGPLLVHNSLGPRPPPPSPSNISGGVGG